MGVPEIFKYFELRPYLCEFSASHPLGSAARLCRPMARALGCSPSQAYNIILGLSRAQPEQVPPLARFLGLDAAREEHLRLLVARTHAEGRESADIGLSIWASHAAHTGRSPAPGEQDLGQPEVPWQGEAAVLGLLPMIEEHAPWAEGPRAKAELLLFGPDAAVFERALPCRAEARLEGEERAPRLRVLAPPGPPGSWSNAAWHGYLELARDGFIRLRWAERASFMAVANADQEAVARAWRAVERLTTTLRALVRRSAESRVDRLYLCLSELVHITTEPALQRDCPPVQIGPGALTAKERRANAQEERGGSENGLPPGRPCLLHYLEFSPFALAWLAWKLASRKRVSYRSLAKKAGLSKSLLQELFKGASRLLPGHIPKLLKILDLPDVEVPYLEGLSRLANTTDVLARASELRALFAWAEQHGGVRTAAADHFLLRSHWSGVAVQALTELPGYDPHEVWMSLALRGRITPDHARRIRAALTRTGWMGEDGLPIHRDEPELARMPGEDVDAVHAFHQSGLALVRTDLRLPGALPRLRGLVLALPSDDFARAREALQGCRSEILEALRGAEQRARAGQGHLDRVISAQLQLFPLTVPLKRR